MAEYCFTTPQGQTSSFEEQKNSVLPGKVPGPDGHWIDVRRAIDRNRWEKLKDVYYAERGWDPGTGIPTRAKLEELDLKDIADDLEKIAPPGK